LFRVSSLLLIVAALVAAGCGSEGNNAEGSGRLTVLSNVAPVEKAFNADKGHARLVLILSPT
jgi:hypothetical protein